jgi:hypothetical protein
MCCTACARRERVAADFREADVADIARAIAEPMKGGSEP